MNNIIKLEIDKSLIAVAGYEFGRHLAIDQIVDRINPNEINEIQFPEHVEIVATGCTLSGIYGEIYHKYPNIKMSNIKIIMLNDGKDISRED